MNIEMLDINGNARTFKDFDNVMNRNAELIGINYYFNTSASNSSAELCKQVTKFIKMMNKNYNKKIKTVNTAFSELNFEMKQYVKNSKRVKL